MLCYMSSDDKFVSHTGCQSPNLSVSASFYKDHIFLHILIIEKFVTFEEEYVTSAWTRRLC